MLLIPRIVLLLSVLPTANSVLQVAGMSYYSVKIVPRAKYANDEIYCYIYIYCYIKNNREISDIKISYLPNTEFFYFILKNGKFQRTIE